MTNLIKPRNSIVIQSVNENVIPKYPYKNSKTPEKSITLAFFFISNLQCSSNVNSMYSSSLFSSEFKEEKLNNIRKERITKLTNIQLIDLK